MTGLELAKQSGARVVIGEANGYHWPTSVIVLQRPIALGSNLMQLLVAAHEAEHHRQHHRSPWLRWGVKFVPVAWWCEIDAWRRAVVAVATI